MSEGAEARLHRRIEQLEAQLAATQRELERTRAVIDAAQVGLGHFDLQQQVVDANPAMERFLGRDGPFTDLVIRQMSHPDDMAVDEQYIGELLDGKRRSYQIQKRYLRPDGETVWGLLQVTLYDDEHRRYGVVSLQDITALKRAEEKLKVIAETAPVGVGISHLSTGAVLYANPALAAMLGTSTEAILDGAGLQELYIDGERDRMLQLLDGQGHVSGHEVAARRATGETFCARLYAQRVELSEGPCLVGTAIDVTEERQLEDQLRRSVAEKEVLLREIHHRVKNNLQVVSSLLFLQAQPFAGSEVGHAFVDCRRRILTMAAIHEALYAHGDLARLALDELLRDVTTLVRSAQSLTSTRVELQLALDPVQVDIDQAVPIGLIVSELLANAYEHAFPDGAGRVDLRLAVKGDQLALSVHDNGLGMAEAPSGGDGLGLEVVRQLAAQGGGSLTISSEPGQGTRVTLLAPAPSSSTGRRD